MRCLYGPSVVCVRSRARLDPTHISSCGDPTLGRSRWHTRETTATSWPTGATKTTAPEAFVLTLTFPPGVIPPTPLVERPPGRKVFPWETLRPTVVVVDNVVAVDVVVVVDDDRFD